MGFTTVSQMEEKKHISLNQAKCANVVTKLP